MAKRLAFITQSSIGCYIRIYGLHMQI